MEEKKVGESIENRRYSKNNLLKLFNDRQADRAKYYEEKLRIELMKAENDRLKLENEKIKLEMKKQLLVERI